MGQKRVSYKSIVEGVKDIYSRKIRPVEEYYGVHKFYHPLLSDADIEAKPMVLLLGQYSTGKTSLIQKLLGGEYPGSYVGIEPTTDKFIAIMHGPDERVIPGNAATSQTDKPFRTLSSFGYTFLNKFELSTSPSSILESISFVDTPGVLSGEKQRLGRSYDFVHVCEWFAEKADLILLLFDAHKLDISDEFRSVLTALKIYDDKIRVILNKVDMIENDQLFRVYGALMWSLGKIIMTPEVPRVYVGSFGTETGPESTRTEMEELLVDLMNLPQESAIRKVNRILRRCKLARIHAHLTSALRSQMPIFWGKSAKQTHLIKHLDNVFLGVQKKLNIPMGDFPDISAFRETLASHSFENFHRLNTKLLDKLETAINVDIPKLMQEFPQGPVILRPVQNPFGTTLETDELNSDVEREVSWDISVDDMIRYEKTYYASTSGSTVLSGEVLKSIVSNSGLEDHEMAKIWSLVDLDRSGTLDLKEFAVFMKILEARIAGASIPSILPEPLQQYLE